MIIQMDMQWYAFGKGKTVCLYNETSYSTHTFLNHMVAVVSVNNLCQQASVCLHFV